MDSNPEALKSTCGAIYRAVCRAVPRTVCVAGWLSVILGAVLGVILGDFLSEQGIVILDTSNLDQKMKVNQGIKYSARNAISVILIFGLLSILFFLQAQFPYLVLVAANRSVQRIDL